MSEPDINWTFLGGCVVVLTSVVSALRWLFARPSAQTMNRLHQENLNRFDDLAAGVKRLEVPLARIEEKIQRAEMDILELRKWKHEKGDPYIGAVEVLKARIDSLEVKKRYE